jgi:hypothetical protein
MIGVRWRRQTKSKRRVNMKWMWMVVLVVLAGVVEGRAETQTLQVWGSGSVVYAQAVLGNPMMANHTMTARVRFVNESTGAATNWVPRTEIGKTSVATTQMTRKEGSWRAEAEYTVGCPVHRYDSFLTRLLQFKIGFSLNCMYKIPGTESIAYTLQGQPYYVAKYSKVPGCYIACAVQDASVFTTPYSYGKASDNIQFRYWWMSILGYKTCLDYSEANRNSCYQGSCGEFVQ